MRRLLGLLFRLVLAASLAMLPVAQSRAMAPPEAPSLPCHAAGKDDASSGATGHSSHGGHTGDCCGTAQCHCIGAIVLPHIMTVAHSRIALRWDAWIPEHPHDHSFAPTPPPPPL